MGLPKKKSTRHRKKSRASHFGLTSAQLTECSHCKRSIAPHRACQFCGHYKGKEVFKVLTKEEKKKAREAKAKAKREGKTPKKK
ncbi:MAG: 50S ribosomal protein L32 [Patescibacteria group bacterium]